MMQTFRCPHCGKLLDTDNQLGTTVSCPHCDEPFDLAPARLAARGSGLLYKVLVPLGYVLFVGVPLALTVMFLKNRAEEVQREEQAQKQEQKQERPPVVVRPKDDPPRPKPPHKRPVGPKVTEPDEPDAPDVKPKDELPPAHAPVTPPVVHAVAPCPREVPVIEVAPDPRRIVWRVPPGRFTGAWQSFNGVDLRVADVVVTKVPLVNGRGIESESRGPQLVVVIEARANALGKKRELKSWTYGRHRYFAGFLANRAVLPFFDTDLGTRVHTGLPAVQPLAPDGPPARDVIVFTLPPAGAGELSLRLDGDRVGETKDLWFKVPESAWK
jgi:hypothetical protein